MLAHDGLQPLCRSLQRNARTHLLMAGELGLLERIIGPAKDVAGLHDFLVHPAHDDTRFGHTQTLDLLHERFAHHGGYALLDAFNPVDRRVMPRLPRQRRPWRPETG